MNRSSAAAREESTELSDDVADIIRNETLNYDGPELNPALDPLSDDEREEDLEDQGQEETLDGYDGPTDSGDEDGQTEDETLDGESTESKTRKSDSNPSYSDLVNYLRENNPELAEVAAAQQAEGSRMAQQFNDYRREVLDLKETALKAIEQGGNEESTGEAEEAQPETALSRLSPMQQNMNRQLFQELAAEMGYIRQETLDQEAAEASAAEYGQAAENSALEKYGEMYGSSEDGSVNRNSGAERLMLETLDRVEDPDRGLTHEDLFVISNIEQIKEAAKEEGRREAGGRPGSPSDGERKQRARKGTVATRTSGRENKGRDNIYKGYGNDSIESVIDRANTLSQQELGWR